MRFERVLLLIFVFTLVFTLSSCSSSSGISGNVVHEQYSSFSSVEDRFSLVRGLFSDDIVYNTAFFSVNGSSWQSLNLSGTFFPGDDSGSWLLANASLLYPSGLDSFGEHYLLFYSCSGSLGEWDCHPRNDQEIGFWQLFVFDNTYSNCGDSLDYQCGVKNICGLDSNFGSCPSGYDCSDNLCLARSDLSCGGVTCGSEEYCSRGVCLLTVPGDTYFVATWGAENNSGTFEEPFLRWQQAVDVMQPGDISYFRGGVWMPTERVGGTYGMSIDMSGTADAPIRYFNYPGEKPILDANLMSPDSYRWSNGISMHRVEHIRFKGLTIRQIHQNLPDFSHVKSYSEVFGVGCSSCANLHFENVAVHDVDGRGFSYSGGAWTDFDAERSFERCIDREESDPDGDASSCVYPTPIFENDNTSWINCDAYNLFDAIAPQPGNSADGWIVMGSYYGNNFYFDGCRAFNFSDDGFNPNGNAFFTFKNCWSMSSDKYDSLSSEWGIEGNGFKLPAVTSTIPNYVLGELNFYKIENSITADNVGNGFYNNLFADGVSYFSNNALVYNNLAYRNYAGFSDGGSTGFDRTSIFNNNIAYKSTSTGYGMTPLYEVAIYRPSIYPHSNNNWLGTMQEEGWPGWEYNPAMTVSDEDFISTETSQLMRPRKVDGSLPDLDFAHLREGSDLIDAGIIIPGYHCPTAGEHPGVDCAVWYGNAPDLGPFESNYSSEPEPEQNITYYLVENGFPLADIVVASDAPNMVGLAADYFQMYVNDITGATLSISNTPNPSFDFHVYIGQSDYTDALGITSDGCEFDGFRIVSGDDYLVLLGDDAPQSILGFGGIPGPGSLVDWDVLVADKWDENYLWDNDFFGLYGWNYNSLYDIWESDGDGSMNAVFEFLYDQGIRWYHHGWHEHPGMGTIIPSKQDIAFEPVDKLVNPNFMLRDFMMYGKFLHSFNDYHYGAMYDESLRWVLSLRSNTFYEFMVGSLGGPSHGLHAIIARQTEAHPEFYAVYNGVPQINVPYPSPNLCHPYYTDENTLFEEVVKYSKTMFDVYNITMVDLMPTDGLMVISDECKEKENTDEYLRKFSNYVWDFVNNVAWEIYEDSAYEGKYISCNGYTTYLLPPDNLSRPVAPNLAVHVSLYRSRLLEEGEKEFSDNLVNSWVNLLASNNALTEGVETNLFFTSDFYGNNYPGTGTQPIPLLMPHTISDNIKSIANISRGEVSEIYTYSTSPLYDPDMDTWLLEWDVFAANSFNIYVLSRLYWDPYLDIDVLLEEYYDLFYGPAAEEMKIFLEYSETYYNDALVDPSIIPMMRSLLADARIVAGDTVYGHRIDLLIGLMDSVDIEPVIEIDSCQDLEGFLATYLLTQDVSVVDDTCFFIGNVGVTLDCQGNTITYSAVNDGARALSSYFANAITIKNCVIEQEEGSGGSAEGIQISGVTGINFTNNSFDTIKSSIWLIDSEDIIVSDSRIHSDERNALSMQDVTDAVFINNNLSSVSSYPVYFYETYNSSIIDNLVVSDESFAVYLVRSFGNTVSDNYLETRSPDVSQIVLEHECSGTIVENNVIVFP